MRIYKNIIGYREKTKNLYDLLSNMPIYEISENSIYWDTIWSLEIQKSQLEKIIEIQVQKSIQYTVQTIASITWQIKWSKFEIEELKELIDWVKLEIEVWSDVYNNSFTQKEIETLLMNEFCKYIDLEKLAKNEIIYTNYSKENLEKTANQLLQI